MIRRDEFRTGDNVLSPFVIVQLTIPDNVWIMRTLQGVLLLPCHEENWIQEGTASVTLAEQTFVDIYKSIDFTPNYQDMFYDCVPLDPDVTVIASFGVNGQYLRLRDFTIAIKSNMLVKAVGLTYNTSNTNYVTQVQITAGSNVGNLTIPAGANTVETQWLDFDNVASTNQVSMVATAGIPALLDSNLRLREIRVKVQ